jgi:RNA polymerase sigma-70 factor (ECF subfamily)
MLFMMNDEDPRRKEVLESVAGSTLPTRDLATRMLALEDEAFKEFGRVFGPKLRTYFLHRGLSTTDAEDLAKSCVTDIALKVSKYQPREDAVFAAWVFSLGRNYVADWWRAHKTTEPLHDNFPAEEPSEPDCDEQAVHSEVTVAVREALAELGETSSTIIQLRDLGVEHSYQEIGERLGITPEAARVRHFRALRQLEARLVKDPRIDRYLQRNRRERSLDGTDTV